MKRGKTYEWIPLWVEKWLWGSTRIELTPAERSVWVDLMALGSKDDGYIRANETTPYLDQQLAGILCIEADLLHAAVEKCIQYGKLAKDDNGILYIVNWNEYSLTERHKRRVMSAKADMHVRVSGRASTYKSQSISYSSKGRVWEGIAAEDLEAWAKAYPACDLKVELAKMGEWILANPTKAVKSNWRRFITNWLSRQQDRGGTNRVPGRRAGSDTDSLIDGMKIGKERS